MAVASSGALSLSALAEEFGGTGPISLSALYRGAGRVPAVGAPNIGIPASGALRFSVFRGSARTTQVGYEMIGGGGGGGYGVADGTAGGRAGDGGTTVVAPAGLAAISAAGGLGGLHGQAPRSARSASAPVAQVARPGIVVATAPRDTLA
jgi:hypothetical protein